MISDGVPEGDGEVGQQDGADEGFRHKCVAPECAQAERGSYLAIRSGIWDGSVDWSMAGVVDAVHHPLDLCYRFQ